MSIRKMSEKKKKALSLAGKPIPYSTIEKRGSPRKSNPKRKARKPSETLRIYGPPARRKFVRSLPCAACGVQGFSVQAHVLGNGGTGRKADADTIAPLCGHAQVSVKRGYIASCHTLFDDFPWEFCKRFPDFNSEQAAKETEKLWQDHLKGESA